MIGILRHYRQNKLVSKWMKTCHDLEYLKMEKQYLINPCLNDLPVLQHIVKIHVLQHKINSTIFNAEHNNQVGNKK